ncbi:sodium/potassium-transporting ATPase subunit beta-1-interacting protein 3-like [Spinachia spinachia]
MGCCSARCMLILLCCLQLVRCFSVIMLPPKHICFSLVIRDGPIFFFFSINYKCFDLRPRYVLWTLLWVCWNDFVSCLHLDLGGLSKKLQSHDQHFVSVDSGLLCFGTD